MADIDVTDKVKFGWPEGESLPLTRCVCGQKYDEWDFIIGVYSDSPYFTIHSCTVCGRKLYFSNQVRVYQVEE